MYTYESDDTFQLVGIVTRNLQKTNTRPNYRLNDKSLDSIKLTLLNEALWHEFYHLTTEMIVTKMGRRMFPTVELKVEGLEERSLYSFVLEFVQLGQTRWKFSNSTWSEVSKSEPPPARDQAVYIHPQSPQWGANWMDKNVHFDKVKITNKMPSEGLKSGQVLLNSLHRYSPRIHVLKGANINGEDVWTCRTFIMQKTDFIAVTAYQNQSVTRLKIQHNPYARAFEKGKSGSSNHKNQDESEDQYSDQLSYSESRNGEIIPYPCPNDPYQSFTNGYPLNTEPHWGIDYGASNVDGHAGPIRSNFYSRPNGPYGVGFGPAKCS